MPRQRVKPGVHFQRKNRVQGHVQTYSEVLEMHLFHLAPGFGKSGYTRRRSGPERGGAGTPDTAEGQGHQG
jgi:hypothetical protein